MKNRCQVPLGLRPSMFVFAMTMGCWIWLTTTGAAPAQEIVRGPVATTWFVEEPADEQLPPLLDEEDLPGEDVDENRNDNGTRGFRRFWPTWRQPDEHERNHRVVREAFRDVVKDANQSTVQIYSGERRVALGTIIDADGLILTKASELSSPIQCRLTDGRKYAAELVAVKDELDVAVLRIDASDLKAIAWRKEETPVAGSWLATAGAGDLPLAVGVVSAAPREIPMPQPVLGIVLIDSDSGPMIDSILPESPAEEAGLEEKDVVLEIDGRQVKKKDRLIDLIRERRPGDRVELRVQRGQKSLSIKATLTEINSLAQGSRVDFQNSLGGPLSLRRWGFKSVLQHDTVLRPRDCGGPIVDLAGNAVGLNIARAGRVASYAVPFSALAPIFDEVRSGTFARVPPRSDESMAGTENENVSLETVETSNPTAVTTGMN